MSRVKDFPPPVGWVPVVIGSLLAILVSVVAVAPAFRSRVETKDLGTESTGELAAATQTAESSSASSSNAKAAGSKVATSGSACAPGRNGGNTAPGVTASEIRLASTIVTTGNGEGFLGEAAFGMQAAVTEVNNQGGICGRRIVLDTNNSGWDAPTGQKYIDNYISSGKYFALVGEPDSEGLGAAIDSGLIDRASIPVVGTDGMLKNQYNDPWVWPVAASTVTNMHIIAQYAVSKLGVKSANDFGIVFDTRYKFGPEGAKAFAEEIRRLTGEPMPSFVDPPRGCGGQYCGISSDAGSYSSEITTFDSACKPCKVVVMLLEPKPMETWMQGEQNAGKWYENLFGGEPLFDDNVGENCPGCAGMIVWTGYRPSIQPFDGEKPVYGFCHALKSAHPSADCHNEFTEGAYLGTRLFIEAAKLVGPNLTRAGLKKVLDSQTFDLGLSQPLRFGSASPRLSNLSMAAFQDNYAGSFNGWTYLTTGFIADPHPGADMR